MAHYHIYLFLTLYGTFFPIQRQATTGNRRLAGRVSAFNVI